MSCYASTNASSVSSTIAIASSQNGCAKTTEPCFYQSSARKTWVRRGTKTPPDPLQNRTSDVHLVALSVSPTPRSQGARASVVQSDRLHRRVHVQDVRAMWSPAPRFGWVQDVSLPRVSDGARPRHQWRSQYPPSLPHCLAWEPTPSRDLCIAF